MALITLTYVFSVGNTIIASQHNTNNSTIYNDYNGNITDANIAAGAGIEYTKLALNNTIKGSDATSPNTANGLVVLNSSGKIPAIDGSLLTNVVSTTNANTNGNQLGSWVSKTNGTTYQAATDGFVVGYGGCAVGGSLSMFTDSSSTPTTQRVSCIIANSAGNANGTVMSGFMPVKKNDYWLANGSGQSWTTLYWIPMGS